MIKRDPGHKDQMFTRFISTSPTSSSDLLHVRTGARTNRVTLSYR